MGRKKKFDKRAKGGVGGGVINGGIGKAAEGRKNGEWKRWKRWTAPTGRVWMQKNGTALGRRREHWAEAEAGALSGVRKEGNREGVASGDGHGSRPLGGGDARGGGGMACEHAEGGGVRWGGGTLAQGQGRPVARGTALLLRPCWPPSFVPPLPKHPRLK